MPTTLSVYTSAIKGALAQAAKFVPSSTHLPVLTCVHLKAVALQGIVIEATNLEAALRIRIPGADNDFDTAVPAKTLADVFAAIDGDTANLSLDTGKLLVSAPGTKTRIAVVDAGEFPRLPICGSRICEIPAATLKRALKKVVFAASSEETRPSLMAVHLAREGDAQLSLSAADGFRLAVQILNIPITLGESGVLIPAAVLRKLIPLLPESEDEIVTLSLSDNASAIEFACGSIEIYAQLLDAKFPDVKAVIPAQFKHVLELPSDFGAAVRRAEIFAGANKGGHLSVLSPTDDGKANGLVVTGANEETGESRTTFNAVPMPFKLGLNGIFLAQGLEAIGAGNQVHLHLNTANAPVMLTNGSREYIYILMPMVTANKAEVQKAAAAAEASEQAGAGN